MSGTVYFALVGDFIKVGYSKDPRSRLRNIRGGRDLKPAGFDPKRKVEVLRLVPGTLITEALCHSALRDHLAAGEWFHHTPQCLAAIAWLVQDPDRIEHRAVALADSLGQAS